jgi:hypothetical protein
MNINSERANAIDAYLSSHPDAEVGRWPLEIGGRKEILPFYRIPIKDLLCYNVNNGRLAMDVREWEKVNGRTLDATIPEDCEIIRQMLLNLDRDKTSLLKEDIRKKNQMEPGVITHDGFVVNGNRRMAVLEELHGKEPTGKWLFLEAVRLPSTITEKDIWKIEAGLQLSKDKIAEYHPVNELLKIKQGIEARLSPAEIAAAMYGRTAEEIDESLKRLQLIDDFLDFFGQPGNYGLIRKFGLHEYFIDIQKNVMVAWKHRGLTKPQCKEELVDSFALISAGIRVQATQAGKRKDKGITHWDIRKLGKIFADPAAKEAYTQSLKKSNKKPLSVDAGNLIEDFKVAEDILLMKEQRDQPVRLIDKAIKALQSIDRTNKHFHETRVKSAMDRLYGIVQEIKKDLEK